jgi:hypothetical protein
MKIPGWIGMIAVALALPILGHATPPDHHDRRTFTSFDAPGSPNGTYALSMNSKGTITGFFFDANGIARGYARYCAPAGHDRDCDQDDSAFAVFDAPGANQGLGSGTFPSSINSRGAITGTFADAAGATRGFLRDCNHGSSVNACEKEDITIITIDVPGAFSTTPTSINAEGAITGYYLAGGANHGFLWSCKRESGRKQCEEEDSTYTTFDIPGVDGTYPTSINSAGTITGYSIDFYNAPHGFVRGRDGIITNFDVPDSLTTQALSINPAGTITGNFTDANQNILGFVRAADGNFTTFRAPDAINTFPTSINPGGAIAGGYLDVNNAFFVFLRAPDGRITKIASPLIGFSDAVSINPAETIAGYYIGASGQVHGFLVTNAKE